MVHSGWWTTFFDQISAMSKSCYSHVCALRCIRPFWTSSQPESLLLPSATQNLTTATLYITVFQALNYIGCNKIPFKASKCTHITPKLKSFHSVHWLKVKERNKLLNTTQPSYLYDSIILQLPRFTRSSSVLIDHQPAQHWKAQIAHFEIFDIHHLVSGINYLTHFVTNSNFVLGSFSRKSPNTNTYHAVIIQDSPIFSAQ